MTTITRKQLKSLSPCSGGFKSFASAFKGQKEVEITPESVYTFLCGDKRFDHVCWMLRKLAGQQYDFTALYTIKNHVYYIYPKHEEEIRGKYLPQIGEAKAYLNDKYQEFESLDLELARPCREAHETARRTACAELGIVSTSPDTTPDQRDNAIMHNKIAVATADAVYEYEHKKILRLMNDEFGRKDSLDAASAEVDRLVQLMYRELRAMYKQEFAPLCQMISNDLSRLIESYFQN